jgi:hypothetical protein
MTGRRSDRTQIMNVSFEPLADDDPLRPAVERAERALRQSIAYSLRARDEMLLGSNVAGCSCVNGVSLGSDLSGARIMTAVSEHNHSYEHLLASIYHTLYVDSWPIPREKITAALRPRAAVLGPEVAEAVEAILDSNERNALAMAFRLVAQTAVLLKGGY